MTPKNIAVAPALLEALEERAAAEGKTVDEAANEAIKAGLEEQSWAAFTATGRAYGAASGVDPEDLERLREDFRAGR